MILKGNMTDSHKDYINSTLKSLMYDYQKLPSSSTLQHRTTSSLPPFHNETYEYYIEDDFDKPLNLSKPTKLLPTGVVIVIVLALLCAVMGLIYAYVYFTKINKNSLANQGKMLTAVVKPPKHSSELLRVPHHHPEDERSHRDSFSQNASPSTHVFLFKMKR